MKLTKTEQTEIENMLKGMSTYIMMSGPVSRCFHHSCMYQKDYRKPAKQARERLQERGLIAYSDITPAGWDYLETSPIKLFIEAKTADLTDEIRYAQAMKIDDAPMQRISPSTYKFFCELYKNPDMTHAEIYEHDLDRIFQNRCNHEQRMQEIEQQIARAELYQQFYT